MIEAAGGRWFPSLRTIWAYRDLLYYLTRREVTVRYKQSVIGAFWAILQPALLAVVFSVFFGLLVKVSSLPGIPYPVFALSGLTLWLFISTAMSDASESTIANEELISKVYFPRILIPISSVAPPAVDFLFAFVVVIGTMLVYSLVPEPQVVIMPAVFLFALVTALGISLWLSALHVRYRDVHHVVPFMVLVGFFVSPIIYTLDLVPDHLQPLYALNPVVGVITSYRWALFGSADWSLLVIAIPVAVSFLVLVTGAAYFERAERTFADVI